ncbi:EAL domain-containing protein [Blastomonas marina]|uniref:EAL domain-containing protein n=1 Tax=Blastomonas marina TaxID=1867408 RepID=UPI002AC98ADA|nr:EAL domain-containing protein [Blastomonas marina]WPZ04551.1 EAL domain-containing protein [Blastomonas marina]
MLEILRRNSGGDWGKYSALLDPLSREEIAQSVLLMREYESSGHGWFWSTDSHGRITYISPRLAAQIGFEDGQLIGRTLGRVFVEDREIERAEDDDGRARGLKIYLAGRKAFSNIVIHTQCGKFDQRWALSGHPQRDNDGRFAGYRGHAVDVTEQYRSESEASRLAMFDSLTGLSNRHRLTSQLDREMKVCVAAKRSCAVMMLDLDRFKAVNDTLGHQAGDELLKQVAQRLRNLIKDEFELGRLGGDEFQIILPDIDDRGRLADLGHSIVTHLSQPYSVDGNRCVIGASVGIAVAPYDGITSEELVRGADLALYAAKGSGRGQFRFYSSELHDKARERNDIEEALRDALQNEELSLHYQPFVHQENGKVAGYEALMRWQHPKMGWIEPSKFIPIAEETNLITSLGEWAIRQACRDAAKWPNDVSVAINVSAAQFQQEGLAAIIGGALAASAIDPARLEMEITESVFISDMERTDKLFRDLKKLGVRLSLDDFGTGFSSLSYLGRAPFDKVKIDRSFVVGSTEEGSRNPAIISAIVSVAGALGMRTTVEGVEALDELALVREKGVDYIQGYLFSKPLTQDKILEKQGLGEWVLEAKGPSRNRAQRLSVLRKIGVIHGDYRYEVRMRNLSRTGAMIEGVSDVPVGTELVLDLGEGQLAVATVRRSEGDVQGVEFETGLVNDGADGLCTRFRISPYALAAAGMPLQALPPGAYPLAENVPATTESRPSFETRTFADTATRRGSD